MYRTLLLSKWCFLHWHFCIHYTLEEVLLVSETPYLSGLIIFWLSSGHLHEVVAIYIYIALTVIMYLPAYLAFNISRNCLLLDVAQISAATCSSFCFDKVTLASSYSLQDWDHRQWMRLLASITLSCLSNLIIKGNTNCCKSSRQLQLYILPYDFLINMQFFLLNYMSVLWVHLSLSIIITFTGYIYIVYTRNACPYNKP